MKSSFWGIVFKYFEPKDNISEVEEGGKNDNEHDTGVWSVPQKIAFPFYIQARCQIKYDLVEKGIEFCRI